MSNYPSEETLTKIKTWDLIEQPWTKFLDFLEEVWIHENGTFKLSGSKKNRKLYLATGGWSGNEDIIAALHKNYLFWMMYWYKSQRGGAYWFTFF